VCTGNIIEFGIGVLTNELVHGKAILEVGSYNVNGSLKDIIIKFNPKLYVGVDIREGPNVDIVCDIYNIEYLFGMESFDGIVCTEVLEHVEDWCVAIYNLRQVVKPGGFILITVPTIGFPYHEYPSDYWRFTLDDFRKIFYDFEWKSWKQHNDPGVCILISKPLVYTYADMTIPKIRRVI
jgi:SAM-dependent methyltransferase